MICRVVYILIMCHLSELGDAVKFLFVKKKTKKEKNFLLYFAIRRRKFEGRHHDTIIDERMQYIIHQYHESYWSIFQTIWN
jgi:hypothetical protein